MNSKKYSIVQIKWNNVQFYPEKEGMWYRGEHKGIIFNSHIRYDNNILSISYFTYGDILSNEELKGGWSATIYKNNKSITSRGLHDNSYITAKDVENVENIYLKWYERNREIEKE